MALISRIRTVATGVVGSPWYINMHFATGEGLNVQDQVQAVTDFWTQIRSHLDQRITYTVEGEVTEIESTTGAAVGVLNVPSGVVTGGANRAALPPSNQILIRLSTSVYNGGRRIQGRIFVPGATTGEADVTGQMNPLAQADFASAVLPLRTEGLVVFSKTTGEAPPVTGSSVWNQFAVLRSRRD